MIADDYSQWLSLGQAHQRAGRPIDAMLCYRQALRSNRHAVIVQYHLGETWRVLGRREDAAAAWTAALTWQPQHAPSLAALGDLLRETGAWADAATQYRRALAADPQSTAGRRGLVLALLAAGDAGAYAQIERLPDPDARSLAEDAEFAQALALAPSSAQKRAALERFETLDGAVLSPLLNALAAEHAIAEQPTDPVRAQALLSRAARREPAIDDVDALVRLALTAEAAGAGDDWAKRYAQACATRHAPAVPSLWPRRTAGDALRVVYLIAPAALLSVAGHAIDPGAYLRNIVAKHPRDRFVPAVLLVGDGPLDVATAGAMTGFQVGAPGRDPDPAFARALAEADYDVLIDLGGMHSGTGPLLAARPARTLWTYADLTGAHAPPLITHTLPSPHGAEDDALAAHRKAIERALIEACTPASWFSDRSTLDAVATGDAWRGAISSHQAGRADEAIACYRGVLAQQPGFAPAHYFLAMALRDRGRSIDAAESLRAALASAPAYAEARAALAHLERDAGRIDAAATLCREGLALEPASVALWRALGLAELARHDGEAARAAFEHALSISLIDAETHYNHGVALQMLRLRDDALRAYQRALAFAPDLIAADFNIGVILHEQGRTDAAIAAFEQVLARDPRHVLAHKALGDTLLGARRINDWLKVFDRFEANCPNALSLAVQALEVYQYRGDFSGLDRYLDRIRQDDFKPESETDLADCLEQLLFLLLYFDIEQEAHFGLYRAYDAVAQRVHGKPLQRSPERRPGRVRVGYLSGDFRNQVMGKMMWSAVQHHDRERFELFFYALNAESDEWTERYRALGERFETLADLPEREAARCIALDDLDILVDLSTHTKGAKPGILALKPARVQITHVASAGVVGLSAIDFKLTDTYADVPENQAFQIERLLPMRGCVYPYRHMEPAAKHPFHRASLNIAADATVVGAFVNALKLSRRCLSLWREVLERAPRAVLAISPLSPEAREVYARLFAAAGIPLTRVMVLPQGRNDEENQARYNIVDFVLDPLPYGGVNGTLEALDMGVPVVTLCGRKHGERTSYSILANLGVEQTVAKSGSEYVEIALRLATDAAFMAQVRGAIERGLAQSPLTDMRAHTRALEDAYEAAFERAHPQAIASIRR